MKALMSTPVATGVTGSSVRQRRQARRNRFADALVDMDDHWASLFADTPFSDLAYSDMLIRLWQHGSQSIPKMDLYESIRYVSYGTAVKYVQKAVDMGIILESSDPRDRRIKRVCLSPDARATVERFLDFALHRFGL